VGVEPIALLIEQAFQERQMPRGKGAFQLLARQAVDLDHHQTRTRRFVAGPRQAEEPDHPLALAQAPPHARMMISI